ncbi:hypothetical protein [Streptomyces sp. NPDC058280]|uniref:hypothetical protein n=1 Tax=Streptomyces sp. NPDC058280 TaxID=3346419 RepID=UPI0036E9A9B5
MDLVQVFADLDTRPWATLEHAYGSAADVPDALRALASEDEEEAAAALSELYGSILHQGSVYEASAAAVPYLAGLAAAGVLADELLVFLGGVAESEGVYDGTPPGDCQAAVVAQLPLILPLIDADDSGVRQAAVWAAACAGAAGPVLPVLLRRWEQEQDPVVRAELLAGIVRLDGAVTPGTSGAAALATAALDTAEPAELRIAAVLGCLDLELPWTGTHHEAMLSLLPADELVTGRFDLERTEPLQWVVEALLHRETSADREAAFALLDAALRSGDAAVGAEALWAAEQACVFSRSAPARLAAPVTALLDEPASALSAIGILTKLGAHAAPAAPALTALASEADGLADHALQALIGVDPEGAAPLLARDLPERPRALGAAVGFPGGRSPVSFPYHPELLAAVRARLTASDLDGNEPIHLTRLLSCWGERAAPAFPEVAALLGKFPVFVPRAMAAVCPARAVGPLGEAAVSGPEEGRFAAARALHGLTGDPEPLLTVLTAELAAEDTYRIRDAAGATAELGEAAAVLLPSLRAALGKDDERRTTPRMDADLEIALALWRLTGDPDDALPVIAGVLAATAADWMRWTAVRAARAAALLGPAAAALRPALERGLEQPDQTPSMALALLATVPATQNRTRLADLVLASAEDDADPMGAVEALAVLGPEQLSEAHLHRLTALAERDRRVWITGIEPELTRADARFQEAARALLRTAREAAKD